MKPIPRHKILGTNEFKVRQLAYVRGISNKKKRKAKLKYLKKLFNQ